MRTLRQLYLVLSVLLLAAPLLAAPEAAVLPRNVDARDVESAMAVLVGSGIRITQYSSRPAVAGAAGEVTWKVVRDSTSEGMRNVLYRQHLRRPDGVEVPLDGAYVSVHYRHSVFIAAVGQQFSGVRLENNVRLSPREATRIAAERGAGNDVRVFGNLAEHHVDTLAERAELLLIPMAENTFRYAYWTPIDQDHTALVDASEARILRTADTRVRGNCEPFALPKQMVVATGIPARPEVGLRSMYANYAPDWAPFGFSYDGHWQGDAAWLIPNVTVYQALPNGGAYICNQESWAVFPLASPTYADNGIWKGSTAGDALYHARQTMMAFRALGRYGIDGQNSDAHIIFGVAQPDFGTFIKANGTDGRYPNVDVAAFSPPPAGYPYSPAVALDIVAHEFGHGVIYHSANFNLNSTVGKQLHEGFADVYGQIVEKFSEPEGNGVESSSDWDIAEDASINGEYLRSATRDDLHAGHSYYGGYVDNLFHRYDQVSGFTKDHDYGNMLNVVLYLLKTGGSHPSCARLWNCEISVSPIPFYQAAQIMSDVVTHYANPSTQWEQLPQLASLAAFNRYSSCERGGYNAAVQQAAVERAFSAIGYPRLVGAYNCW